MEKFRKWADAPTGINPFPPACVFERSWWLTLLFPLRMLIAVVLVLVLVVVEVLLHTVRASRIPFVGSALLAPLLRVLGAGVLFFAAGGCSPVCRVIPPRASAPNAGSGGGELHPPSAGDVVLCNAVSPWDLWLLLAASDAEWCFGDGAVAVAWVDPRSRIAEPIVFGPSPFQRWRVWRHAWHVSSARFLLVSSGGEEGDDAAAPSMVDLSALHRRALKLGVPLIVFPEGVTSNGKAILRWPHPLRFAGRDVSRSTAGDARSGILGSLCVVAVSYGNDAVPMSFNEDRSIFSYVFRCCTHASRLSGRSTYVSVSRSNADSEGLLLGETERNASRSGLASEVTLCEAWAEDLRQRMAALVQYRNSANNCRAVGVGLAQKSGFVQQWLAAASTTKLPAAKGD